MTSETKLTEVDHKLGPWGRDEVKMPHPIAEGECIILLDPEDDKEFLFRMREKGHINLHKGKILHTEGIPLGRSDLRCLVYPFNEGDAYEMVLH